MEIMLLSFIAPIARCTFNASILASSSLSSVVFVGMMLGAICGGSLSDTVGDQPSFLAGDRIG